MPTPNTAGDLQPTDRAAAASRPVLWLLIAAYAVCSVLDLIAEAAAWDTLSDVFRTFALPLLIAAFLAARPPFTRTTGLVIGALIFSWLGDTIGDASFVIKIVLFLITQWLFIAAFWPYRRQSLFRKPIAVAGYVILMVGLLAVLIPRAGVLAAPVVVYGASLVTMAITASGPNRWGTVGGLCFVISDTLIGVQRFYQLPWPDLMDCLVMLSYLAAEALLVRGTVAVARSVS